MNYDLISREALLKAAKSPCENCKETMKSWCEHCCPVNDFVDIIDNAPAVEYTFEEAFQKTVCNQRLYCPERPQGEWGKWVISEIRCPNCFEYFQTDYYSTEELKKCPNCGAEMKEGTDK